MEQEQNTTAPEQLTAQEPVQANGAPKEEANQQTELGKVEGEAKSVYESIKSHIAHFVEELTHHEKK